MSPLMENQSHDGMPHSGLTTESWIADTFETYKVPSEIGPDAKDLSDEHMHLKYQSRLLGPAYLKSGNFSATHVNFYEVMRSEVSGQSYDGNNAKQRSPLSGYINENGGDDSLADDPQVLMADDETNWIDVSTPGDVKATICSSALLSKKRMAQHCIIFTTQNVDGPEDDIYPGCTYYVFPQNSLVEAANDESPFQIFCTFNLLKSSSRIDEQTNLDIFATVCDSNHRLDSHDTSQKRLVDTLLPSDHQSIHVEISGASLDVCSSLKQITRLYQETCERMVDLLHLHNQRATKYKSDIQSYSTQSSPFTEAHDLAPNTNNELSVSLDLHYSHALDDDHHITNSIKEYHHNEEPNILKDPAKKSYNGTYHPRITSKKKQIKRKMANGRRELVIKQCAYCQAKSTPMWRRGPEGAGTLCNACGVKWKHGKILLDFDPTDTSTTDLDGASSTNKSSGKRKISNPSTKKFKRIRINEQAANGDYASVTLSSSESTFTSPLTSSPNSSPSMSVDSQQQFRGLLTLAFADKFKLDSETLPMDTAADDVEAAALLTLLRQS